MGDAGDMDSPEGLITPTLEASQLSISGLKLRRLPVTSHREKGRREQNTQPAHELTEATPQGEKPLARSSHAALTGIQGPPILFRLYKNPTIWGWSEVKSWGPSAFQGTLLSKWTDHQLQAGWAKNPLLRRPRLPAFWSPF